MGRIYSGKILRDTEKAAETTLFNTLVSSTNKANSDFPSNISITAQLNAETQFDDFLEKKRK